MLDSSARHDLVTLVLVALLIIPLVVATAVGWAFAGRNGDLFVAEH